MSAAETLPAGEMQCDGCGGATEVLRAVKVTGPGFITAVALCPPCLAELLALELNGELQAPDGSQTLEPMKVEVLP